jgi:hypothetical protein
VLPHCGLNVYRALSFIKAAQKAESVNCHLGDGTTTETRAFEYLMNTRDIKKGEELLLAQGERAKAFLPTTTNTANTTTTTRSSRSSSSSSGVDINSGEDVALPSTLVRNLSKEVYIALGASQYGVGGNTLE